MSAHDDRAPRCQTEAATAQPLLDNLSGDEYSERLKDRFYVRGVKSSLRPRSVEPGCHRVLPRERAQVDLRV